MQGAIPNQSHNLSREVRHTTGVYVPHSFRAVAFSQNKIVMGKKILVLCLDVVMLAFFPAGLKCRSQATGQVTGYRSQATGQVTGHRSGYRPQATGQVTGHRSGYRPQATGQVTGQVTGHRSQATGQVTGHPKNNRTLDKTVLD